MPEKIPPGMGVSLEYLQRCSEQTGYRIEPREKVVRLEGNHHMYCELFRDDMLPNNLKAWVFVLVACLIGFVIGQWLKSRRNKVEKNNEYVNGLRRRILADTLAQTKKAKKKKQKNKSTEQRLGK